MKRISKKERIAHNKALAAKENITSGGGGGDIRTNTAQVFTGRASDRKAKPYKPKKKYDLSDTHVDYNEKRFLESAKKYDRIRHDLSIIGTAYGVGKDGADVPILQSKPFTKP